MGEQNQREDHIRSAAGHADFSHVLCHSVGSLSTRVARRTLRGWDTAHDAPCGEVRVVESFQTSFSWVCLAHNAATSFILAFMLPSQAWKIAAVQFWLSCTLQVLEFVCAHMQISNIETVRDAALVDVPQAVSTVTPVTFHGLPAPHLLKSRSRRTQFLD